MYSTLASREGGPFYLQLAAYTFMYYGPSPPVAQVLAARPLWRIKTTLCLKKARLNRWHRPLEQDLKANSVVVGAHVNQVDPTFGPHASSRGALAEETKT
jgi:hypothetical protein